MEDIAPTIDEISKISKLISDYGILIVISAVFILIFIVVITAMIKSNNKQIERTIESNEEMINNLVTQNNQLLRQLSANPTTDNKKEELVKNYLNVGVGLRSICKNIMLKLGSFRVAVYVFHNGNKSAHGLPFFKLTCIAEWLRLRNMSSIPSQTDIPLYLFHNIVKELYINKKVFITKENKNKGNDSDKYENIEVILSDSNNSCVLYGITDSFDNLAAFVLLEFDNSVNINDESTRSKINDLMEQERDTISDIIIFTNESK